MKLNKYRIIRVNNVVYLKHKKHKVTVKLDYEDYIKLKNNNYSLTVQFVTAKKWYANLNGVFVHRIIVNAKKGYYVDHINGDTLDNRKCNLRICKNAQNQWNTGKKVNSKQKYKGVRETKYGTFEARIRDGNKRIHIGSFKTIEEAVKAYNTKALELHGEFAYLNKL